MTYWLARSGQDKPEGPYTQAQLRQRYEAGEADMDDQVCLAGTQAWQDLGKLLDLRAYREAHAPRAAPPPLPQVHAPRGMMPRKPDYSSAGLMIQMQRDADMETAKRCSRAVNLLAVGVVLVSIIPGLGLILALGSMGLLAVVATALCIVTIVKGLVGRGIMDLLAVWVFVPVLIIVMQFFGLGVFAGFAQAFKEGAQQAKAKQAVLSPDQQARHDRVMAGVFPEVSKFVKIETDRFTQVQQRECTHKIKLTAAIEMSAFTLDAPTADSPTFYLRLTRVDDGWEWMKYHDKYVLLDGVSRRLPKERPSTDILAGGMVYEAVTFAFNLQQMREFVLAGDVELKVGGYEVKLTPEQRFPLTVVYASWLQK